jgi:hypothetical protein
MGEAEDSESFDATLLDAEAKHAMEHVMEAVRSFPKKEYVECLLCEEQMAIHTLHDMFRAYASTVSCLAYHTAAVELLDLMPFYMAENFVLATILPAELTEVRKVLEYHRGMEDLYHEALRDQLVSILKTFYVEDSIHINCEQEAESAAYKYYKLLNKSLREEMETRDLELLMVLLYRRSEFCRFFKVLQTQRKTEAVYKLAIALSINPECHVSTEKLLKDVRKFSFEDDGHFTNGKTDQVLEAIREFVGGAGTDLEDWIEGLKEDAHWRDCVKVWAANRKDDTGAVDSSMIELCIKHSKYEDGWLIYEKATGGSDISIHKACMLCLTALKNTQDRRWVERISKIVERATTACPSSSRIVADNILSKVAEFSENCRTQVLRTCSKMVCPARFSEEIASSLLKGFSTLCSKCEDDETCGICADYASQVYEKWKEHRSSQFTFFRRKGEYDGQIYENMLFVCDAVKDCDGFYAVCKDLMSSNTEINKELCHRLEQFHNRNCSGCELKRAQLVTSKRAKHLISHLFKSHR